MLNGCQLISFPAGCCCGAVNPVASQLVLLTDAPRLGWQEARNASQVQKSYVRWAVPLTTLLLFVIFFAAFFGKSPTGSPVYTFFFVVLFTSLHSLIVGAFEIVSGVSVRFRRHLSNEYIVSGAVREAGRARVVYSLMVMALSYWVRQVW